MNHRKLTALLLTLPFVTLGCSTNLEKPAPYRGDSDLSFEIDDGNGIYYSKTGTYIPIYCGTEYRSRKMDIGQDNFDAIFGLVTAGDIWNARVVAVSECSVIDVALPGEYYKFDMREKSVTLKVEQCQRIDSRYEPYLKAMRQIVRNVSDRQRLVVQGRCIRF